MVLSNLEIIANSLIAIDILYERFASEARNPIQNHIKIEESIKKARKFKEQRKRMLRKIIP